MTTVKYKWRKASRLGGDPQVVGEAITNLQNGTGLIGPKEVLDAAKDEDSPLHPYFEWNDSIAANKYRIVQAYEVIRSISVVSVQQGDDGEEKEVLVRAFHVVREGDEKVGDKCYATLDVALSSPTFTALLLQRALRDLEAFKNKYDVLLSLTSFSKGLELVKTALEIEVETKLGDEDRPEV